jgi:hypothetical protein
MTSIETPDLRCDASALGSVYLGGFTWTRLACVFKRYVPVPHAVPTTFSVRNPAMVS